MRPSAPILGAIAFECLVFTAMARDFGVQIAILVLSMSIPLLAAGSLTLGAIAKHRWPRRGRLPLLFAAYLVVGAAATAIVELVLLMISEPRPLWIGAFSFALFMTVLSIAPSMRRAQIESEKDLASAVSDLAVELVRVRSLAEEQRRQYAHLMHGGVQAEMTAAALAISRAAEAGESIQAILVRADELIALLESQRDRLDAAGSTETLADVIDTWRLALDIDLEVDPHSQVLMASDPDLALRVVDVVSEGLTNAVRHASARSVRVVVASADTEAVEVSVVHAGALSPGPSGQGSEVLDACSDEWSLDVVEGQVVLVARMRLADEDSRSRQLL